jgi:hypothetical protein
MLKNKKQVRFLLFYFRFMFIYVLIFFVLSLFAFKGRAILKDLDIAAGTFQIHPEDRKRLFQQMKNDCDVRLNLKRPQKQNKAETNKTKQKKKKKKSAKQTKQNQC